MPSLKRSQTAADSQAIIDTGDSANPDPANFLPKSLTRNHKTISTRSPAAAEHDAQGQPPEKRQRKSHVQSDTATRNLPTLKTRGLPEVARANDESRVTVDHSELERGGTRGKGKFLEWFDNKDKQWKLAGYHHEYRAELLALAAQQPGAPCKLPEPQKPALKLMKVVYSENMGTNHTSFSTLTQGWNEDLDSVVDFQGNPVFSMKEQPEDWIRNTRYGPLVYNGIVMLDDKDNPVRDVPGLPLTLQTEAPAWLLAGLRRCMDFKIEDLMARRPTTRDTLNGIKKNTGSTSLTQSMSRWLQLKNIEEWHPRQKHNKRKQQRRAAAPDHREPEPMEEQDLPPAQARPDLNNLPRDSFIDGSSCSTESPREPVIGPYDQYYNGQQSAASPVLGENSQQENYGSYLGSHSPFTYDPYAFFGNEPYPPLFPCQTTARSIEDHDPPHNHHGQMSPFFDTASAYPLPSLSSFRSNMPYGLFDRGDDFYTGKTQVYLQDTQYLLESSPALGVVDPILSELTN